MKAKFLLLFLLLFVLSIPIYSQNFGLGMELNASNFSTVHNVQIGQYSSGYGISGFFGYDLNDMIGFGTGLEFKFLAVDNINGDRFYSSENEFSDNLIISSSPRIYSLGLPVDVNFYVSQSDNYKAGVFMGSYFNYYLSKQVINEKQADGLVVYYEKSLFNNKLSSMDFGVRYGLVLQFNSSMLFAMKIGYEYGLNSLNVVQSSNYVSPSINYRGYFMTLMIGMSGGDISYGNDLL